MGVSVTETRRREVLRQASVALERRVVVLWRVSPDIEALAFLTSVPEPAHHETKLDLDATLRRWGVPIAEGSLWVGCRSEGVARWCVAPVRTEPAAPSPAASNDAPASGSPWSSPGCASG